MDKQNIVLTESEDKEVFEIASYIVKREEVNVKEAQQEHSKADYNSLLGKGDLDCFVVEKTLIRSDCVDLNNIESNFKVFDVCCGKNIEQKNFLIRKQNSCDKIDVLGNPIEDINENGNIKFENIDEKIKQNSNNNLFYNKFSAESDEGKNFSCGEDYTSKKSTIEDLSDMNSIKDDKKYFSNIINKEELVYDSKDNNDGLLDKINIKGTSEISEYSKEINPDIIKNKSIIIDVFCKKDNNENIINIISESSIDNSLIKTENDDNEKLSTLHNNDVYKNKKMSIEKSQIISNNEKENDSKGSRNNSNIITNSENLVDINISSDISISKHSILNTESKENKNNETHYTDNSNLAYKIKNTLKGIIESHDLKNLSTESNLEAQVVKFKDLHEVEDEFLCEQILKRENNVTDFLISEKKINNTDRIILDREIASLYPSSVIEINEISNKEKNDKESSLIHLNCTMEDTKSLKTADINLVSPIKKGNDNDICNSSKIEIENKLNTVKCLQKENCDIISFLNNTEKHGNNNLILEKTISKSIELNENQNKEKSSYSKNIDSMSSPNIKDLYARENSVSGKTLIKCTNKNEDNCEKNINDDVTDNNLANSIKIKDLNQKKNFVSGKTLFNYINKDEEKFKKNNIVATDNNPITSLNIKELYKEKKFVSGKSLFNYIENNEDKCKKDNIDVTDIITEASLNIGDIYRRNKLASNKTLFKSINKNEDNYEKNNIDVSDNDIKSSLDLKELVQEKNFGSEKTLSNCIDKNEDNYEKNNIDVTDISPAASLNIGDIYRRNKLASNKTLFKSINQNKENYEKNNIEVTDTDLISSSNIKEIYKNNIFCSNETVLNFADENKKSLLDVTYNLENWIDKPISNLKFKKTSGFKNQPSEEISGGMETALKNILNPIDKDKLNLDCEKTENKNIREKDKETRLSNLKKENEINILDDLAQNKKNIQTIPIDIKVKNEKEHIYNELRRENHCGKRPFNIENYRKRMKRQKKNDLDKKKEKPLGTISQKLTNKQDNMKTVKDKNEQVEIKKLQKKQKPQQEKFSENILISGKLKKNTAVVKNADQQTTKFALETQNFNVKNNLKKSLSKDIQNSAEKVKTFIEKNSEYSNKLHKNTDFGEDENKKYNCAIKSSSKEIYDIFTDEQSTNGNKVSHKYDRIERNIDFLVNEPPFSSKYNQDEESLDSIFGITKNNHEDTTITDEDFEGMVDDEDIVQIKKNKEEEKEGDNFSEAHNLKNVDLETKKIDNKFLNTADDDTFACLDKDKSLNNRKCNGVDKEKDDTFAFLNDDYNINNRKCDNIDKAKDSLFVLLDEDLKPNNRTVDNIDKTKDEIFPLSGNNKKMNIINSARKNELTSLEKSKIENDIEVKEKNVFDEVSDDDIFFSDDDIIFSDDEEKQNKTNDEQKKIDTLNIRKKRQPRKRQKKEPDNSNPLDIKIPKKLTKNEIKRQKIMDEKTIQSKINTIKAENMQSTANFFLASKRNLSTKTNDKSNGENIINKLRDQRINNDNLNPKELFLNISIENNGGKTDKKNNVGGLLDIGTNVLSLSKEVELRNVNQNGNNLLKNKHDQNLNLKFNAIRFNIGDIDASNNIESRMLYEKDKVEEKNGMQNSLIHGKEVCNHINEVNRNQFRKIFDHDDISLSNNLNHGGTTNKPNMMLQDNYDYVNGLNQSQNNQDKILAKTNNNINMNDHKTENNNYDNNIFFNEDQKRTGKVQIHQNNFAINQRNVIETQDLNQYSNVYPNRNLVNKIPISIRNQIFVRPDQFHPKNEQVNGFLQNHTALMLMEAKNGINKPTQNLQLGQLKNLQKNKKKQNNGKGKNSFNPNNSFDLSQNNSRTRKNKGIKGKKFLNTDNMVLMPAKANIRSNQANMSCDQRTFDSRKFNTSVINNQIENNKNFNEELLESYKLAMIKQSSCVDEKNQVYNQNYIQPPDFINVKNQQYDRNFIQQSKYPNHINQLQNPNAIKQPYFLNKVNQINDANKIQKVGINRYYNDNSVCSSGYIDENKQILIDEYSNLNTIPGESNCQNDILLKKNDFNQNNIDTYMLKNSLNLYSQSSYNNSNYTSRVHDSTEENNRPDKNQNNVKIPISGHYQPQILGQNITKNNLGYIYEENNKNNVHKNLRNNNLVSVRSTNNFSQSNDQNQVDDFHYQRNHLQTHNKNNYYKYSQSGNVLDQNQYNLNLLKSNNNYNRCNPDYKNKNNNYQTSFSNNHIMNGKYNEYHLNNQVIQKTYENPTNNMNKTIKQINIQNRNSIKNNYETKNEFNQNNSYNENYKNNSQMKFENLYQAKEYKTNSDIHLKNHQYVCNNINRQDSAMNDKKNNLFVSEVYGNQMENKYNLIDTYGEYQDKNEVNMDAFFNADPIDNDNKNKNKIRYSNYIDEVKSSKNMDESIFSGQYGLPFDYDKYNSNQNLSETSNNYYNSIDQNSLNLNLSQLFSHDQRTNLNNQTKFNMSNNQNSFLEMNEHHNIYTSNEIPFVSSINDSQNQNTYIYNNNIQKSSYNTQNKDVLSNENIKNFRSEKKYQMTMPNNHHANTQIRNNLNQYSQNNNNNYIQSNNNHVNDRSYVFQNYNTDTYNQELNNYESYNTRVVNSSNNIPQYNNIDSNSNATNNENYARSYDEYNQEDYQRRYYKSQSNSKNQKN